jgi:hypothetical protein
VASFPPGSLPDPLTPFNRRWTAALYGPAMTISFPSLSCQAARWAAAAAAAIATVGATLSLGTTAAYANTGTITANGPAVKATISTPDVAAAFTFSGTSGEVVTASASSGTFAAECDVSLEILSPSGGTVAGVGCAGQSGFITETPLPGTATYTLKLIPANGDTGSVTLALSADPANAPITADGPAVTFTSGHPGQGRDYTFTGTAGEVVTLSSSGGTFPSPCDLGMQILDPVGNAIGSTGCIAQSGFITETTLPSAGTYIADVYPSGSDPGINTGHLKLALSSDAANAAIKANGPAVTFTASHPGQGRNYTFTGKAGEVVTFSSSGGTFPSPCDLYLQLLSPAGYSLGTASCAAQNGFITETPLPGAGTYTVEVTPTGSDPGANTGHLTLALSSDPANGTIAVGGSPVTFTATHTGQGQEFTFAGTASQGVTLTASAGTFPAPCDLDMQILSPSGSVVAGGSCIAQGGVISNATLPGTGTYIVDVFPSGSNAGSNVGSVKLALT